MTSAMHELAIETVPGEYSVCRLKPTAPGPDWLPQDGRFTTVSRSERELSIVAPSECVPSDITTEHGWRLMRVAGTLDFSLVGILARLTTALADADISVFVVSTFDTDYLMVKVEDEERAVEALAIVATA